MNTDTAAEPVEESTTCENDTTVRAGQDLGLKKPRRDDGEMVFGNRHCVMS